MIAKKLSPVVLVLSLTLCAFAFTSCHKDTQCKCVFTDLPGDGQTDETLRLIGTDGIDCDDITEMAEERHVTDPSTGEHTLERVEVHKVSCRSYGH